MRRLGLLVLLAAIWVAASPGAEASGRWWIGGGFGLGFGDVDFIDMSAFAGYEVTPRWVPGARISYRNREDTRFDRDVTTDDYGGSLFLRYRVWKPVYLQAEYEYLSYERILPDLSTDRESFDSVLAGAGASLPLGRKVGFFASALYNFSYDGNEPGPYTSAWILRTGVGFSF
jgi:hypothetical protein